MLSIDERADALRLQHTLPAGEPPVAVIARALAGKDGIPLLDAELLRQGDSTQFLALLGFHAVRLTADDVVFVQGVGTPTTLATVLQLTGLVPGATYWTEIGTRVQDDSSLCNIKVQCAEALAGGFALSKDELATPVINTVEGWTNGVSQDFLTTGAPIFFGNVSGAIINFQWRGWCVASGGGTITLKGAQIASSADPVTFFATGSVDNDGTPDNTYIRAQKV
jgi:hypothetical protein